jgi:murein DD-endopeptidase MepM/ murein hydrolase activator NlpD
MIRLAALGLILALAACTAATPAPVERRGASFTPPSADRSPEVRARPAAAGEQIVVPEGATLFQIAEDHRVSLRALIDANAIAAPFALEAGQTLRLPAPNIYVVQRGDTLNAIARRHSIQPRSLALLNGLAEPYRLAPGDALMLPGSARASDAGATTEAAAAAPTRTPSSARAPAVTGAAPGFVWPLAGEVIDGFGPKSGGRRNDGINIAARAGDPVRAVADGLVVYAGSDLAGYGALILVKHEGGWISAYAHNRALLVREEQTVTQGQQIAEAGSTGGVDRPQLHFELRGEGGPVDPLTMLPARAGSR